MGSGYTTRQSVLKDRGLNTGLGDEGVFQRLT